MALNYHTLALKPTFNASGNKEASLDLCATTWSDIEPFVIKPIIIDEYYVARPDLVSLAVYGSDEYADLICKWNGISNPFELNLGMIICIPPVDYLYKAIYNHDKAVSDLIVDDNVTIQKPRNNFQRKKSDARSASASIVGDKPAYVIDKTLGLVIY